MIKVKNKGAPIPGAHWSMGPDCMVKISKADAANLCGMYPLPRMGCEMVCAIRPDPKFPSFNSRLMVQNISGDFYLCSPNANIPQWPGMFGVEVQA